MIEQPASVLDVSNEQVTLRTEQQGGCHSCGAKGGCGTSLIAQMFPKRPQQQLRLPRAAFARPPQVGDRIVLGIDEKHLQQTSLLMYAVPLLGLIGGALAGDWLAGRQWLGLAEDPASILLGGAGLALGLTFARRWAATRERAMRNAVKVMHQSPGSVDVAVPLGTPQHR
jgi:sigma-E factor negative regulatory protein RseC